MFGRALATLLGIFGGLLVALAGLAVLVGDLLRPGTMAGVASLNSSLLFGLAASGMGVIMMIVSRPRIFWWRGRSLTTGITLIVMAVAGWVLLRGGLLLALGALLVVVAGVVFAIEEFTHKTLMQRLGLSRRRWF